MEKTAKWIFISSDPPQFVCFSGKYECFMALRLASSPTRISDEFASRCLFEKVLLNSVLWLFVWNYHNLPFSDECLRIKWSVQKEIFKALSFQILRLSWDFKSLSWWSFSHLRFQFISSSSDIVKEEPRRLPLCSLIFKKICKNHVRDESFFCFELSHKYIMLGRKESHVFKATFFESSSLIYSRCLH